MNHVKSIDNAIEMCVYAMHSVHLTHKLNQIGMWLNSNVMENILRKHQ